MALRVISPRCINSVAIGCIADIAAKHCGHQADANDPTETWAAQDCRSAKALFVPSLKRDIVPSIACTRPPAGGVAWQSTSDGENSYSHWAAQQLRGHSWRARRASGCVASRSCIHTPRMIRKCGLASLRFAKDSRARLDREPNIRIESSVLRRRFGANRKIRDGAGRVRYQTSSSAAARRSRRAKTATDTIPVVFSVVNDPVGTGFVATLSHPGGNITGFTFIEYSLVGKWLEMLKEIAPRRHDV